MSPATPETRGHRRGESEEVVATAAASSVELRRCPYPFHAMLAICSDLDETPDGEVYVQLMRFLNTNGETSMGQGVGLEIGNTIYFDMPPGHFSYWNTTSHFQEVIRALIKSGHIDCLHSFGDLATTRAHAERALNELARHDCRIRVWIDHAIASTNFGPDIMRGHGDERNHPAYHADLTVAHGVRYVWRGRVSSVIGQDQSPSLRGIWDAAHPKESAKTIFKEAAKQVLARGGNQKYKLHQLNQTLVPSSLRDGAKVYEFLRCNPHWGGVSSCDTGFGIADVLNSQFLDRLVEVEGDCVLYTHLGKLGEFKTKFGPATIAAFRALRGYEDKKQIRVTTTRRLLDYCRARNELKPSVTERNGATEIHLQAPAGVPEFKPAEVQGLTFYVSNPERTRLFLNDVALDTVANPPDETGRRSVSVRWERLTFPEK